MAEVGPSALTVPPTCNGRANSQRRSVSLRLLLAALVLLAGGCRSLPDTREALARPIPRQPTFESSAGPVSTEGSERIIGKLGYRDQGTAALEQHLAFSQALNSDSPLVLGNRLRLLQNGPSTYAAMFAALRTAADSINIETYIFDDDEVGNTFADLLLERQAAGVQVNIIRDSFGTIATPRAFFDRLSAAGIRILEFNPLNPTRGKQKGWHPNHRDHRKLMLIDGRIAFVGGINISDSYSSAPLGRHDPIVQARLPGWRDTHVRIEGPVVAEFQKLFMATWARQRGDPLPTRDYFPVLRPVGKQIVRAIGSTPEQADSPIYLTLISAISHARKKINLNVAYFAPDRQLRRALTDAVGRGVKVRLVVPSYTDSRTSFYLGRSYYSSLLKGGVEIYQRRGAVMHAKTASIDGVWSTIGSTNLDWRSFVHNDEINAVVLGRSFAVQMDLMFAADLRESERITLARWRQRSLGSRIHERAARLAAHWL